MWKKTGKACRWRHQKAPSAKHLWRDKATDAVLESSLAAGMPNTSPHFPPTKPTHPPLPTRAFDNHSHRARVSRLERGSNRGEPTPLTLASRCGSVGTLPPPRGVYDDAESLRGLRQNEGMSTPKRYRSLY